MTRIRCRGLGSFDAYQDAGLQYRIVEAFRIITGQIHLQISLPP